MRLKIYLSSIVLLSHASLRIESFSVEHKTSQRRGRTPRFGASTSVEDDTATQSPLRSVIKPGIKIDTSVWKDVCPSVFENARGMDVRLKWKKDPSKLPSVLANRVASAMLEKLNDRDLSSPETNLRQTCLATSLEAFMTFSEDHLKPESFVGYSARIVATRGAPSTKCPAWHQDHVPVRWIQSLKGPGCEWVELTEWVAADESDESSPVIEESVEEMNQRRVDPNIPVHQALPGEAVLLVGRSWKECCRREDIRNLPPVVHRSPSGFAPWEGRVLMTMDLLAAEEKDAECVEHLDPTQS